jgi:hypothetical protein
MLGSFIAVALVALRSIKVFNSYPLWWVIEMLFLPLKLAFAVGNWKNGHFSDISALDGISLVRIRRAVVFIMRIIYRFERASGKTLMK